MPAPLTSTQLTDLQAILNDTGLTTDERVVSYYETLASYGYPYGTLALGVADNSTLGGQTGNNFTADFAANNSLAYDSTVAGEIRFELAQKDILARAAVSGDDIPGSTISTYHQTVYADHDLPPQAWIGYEPYQLMGEGAWQSIVSGDAASQSLLVIEANVIANIGLNGGFLTLADELNALFWTKSVVTAAVEASLTDAKDVLGSAFASIVGWLSDIKAGLSGGSDPDLVSAYNSTLNACFDASGADLPHGGSTSIPGFMSGVASLFNRSFTDPIVLDLSVGATGVELTSLADSSAHFDLDNSGFAVHTGWVGATTGLLARDSNSNGSIDNITELFGNSTTDGFTALKTLDTNHDNKITSADSAWSTLKVWTDADSDGVTDSGELQSLSALNITEISLNASETNQTVNGNLIGALATFKRSDNSTGQVAEAFFNNSQMDSIFGGSYDLDPETLLLPNLRGYGIVPDLYIAMSLDSTLKDMVKALVATDLADAATFNDQVKDILYRWTGVDAVDPTSRGTFVNAQDLEAIEALVGQSFIDIYSGLGSSNPNVHQGQVLEAAWAGIASAALERLLAQGPLSSLLESVSFNYNDDIISGTADFSALVGAIGAAAPGDVNAAAKYWVTLAAFVDGLAADLGVNPTTYDTAITTAYGLSGVPLTLSAIRNPVLGSNANDTISLTGGSAHYIGGGDGNDRIVVAGTESGDIIDGGAGTDVLAVGGNVNISAISRISGMEELDVTSAITLGDGQLDAFDTIQGGSAFTINAAAAGSYSIAGKTLSGTVTLNGSSGNDTLTGSSGNDTISGNNGADTINAGDGNDIINGGVGADTINAGDGNDKITISSTESGDIIDGGAGTDILVTGGNVDISGVTSITGMEELDVTGNSVTVGSGQLDAFGTIIAVGNTNNITITAAAAGNYSIAGKTLTSVITLNGSSGSDTLTGSSGNDTINGNNGADTINAGDGNDTINGGLGADTINAGDGNDKITISSTESGDVINGGAGTDILVTGGNVNISGVTSITGMEELDVTGNSVTVGSGQLDAFGTIIAVGNTNNITITAAAAGNYSIAGKTLTSVITLNGSSGSDTLTGSSGNDTINGGLGADTINGGDGNDKIVIGSTESGDVIDGGNGTDILAVGGNVNISGITSITGMEELDITSGGAITVGGGQLDAFAAIVAGSAFTLNAAAAGSYSIAGKTLSGTVTLNGSSGNDTLTGSSGNDTINGNNGADTIVAGDGNDTINGGLGADTINAGDGNDKITISSTESGDVINGGAGTDILVTGGNVDISGVTSITGMEEMDVTGNSVTVGIGQLDAFGTINAVGNTNNITINAAAAGTYSLSGKTTTSTSLTLKGVSGNDTLISGSGNETLNGNGGTDKYQFGTFAQDTVINNGGGTAKGEIDFTTLSSSDLWFKHVGNNLEIDEIGTSNKVTVSSWYSSASSQVASIHGDDSLILDTQLASLVSAMATYATNNPGFDPATAMTMPSDVALQAALASAWHV